MSFDPACQPQIRCPCPNLSPRCIGRAVAESPTHYAIINEHQERVWVPKGSVKLAPQPAE